MEGWKERVRRSNMRVWGERDSERVERSGRRGEGERSAHKVIMTM